MEARAEGERASRLCCPAAMPRDLDINGRFVSAGGKSRVIEALQNRQGVFMFSSKAFGRGHAPTNYTRWLGSHQFYEVEYKKG